LTVSPNPVTLDSISAWNRSLGEKTMKKYAFGAAVVALGIVHQPLPASADKLDDLIKRMDAIEQNNKQLAK
jgi:hypothetical protein